MTAKLFKRCLQILVIALLAFFIYGYIKEKNSNSSFMVENKKLIEKIDLAAKKVDALSVDTMTLLKRVRTLELIVAADMEVIKRLKEYEKVNNVKRDRVWTYSNAELDSVFRRRYPMPDSLHFTGTETN